MTVLRRVIRQAGWVCFLLSCPGFLVSDQAWPAVTGEPALPFVRGDARALDIDQEIALFRTVRLSLTQALDVAERIRPGARIFDISFSQHDSAVLAYSVKTIQGGKLQLLFIDAMLGNRIGEITRPPVRDLDSSSRKNLKDFQAVRQDMREAVRIAEKAVPGNAISGGLLREGGKLNFSIVVLVGGALKQVILEPQQGTSSFTSPRR